MNQLETRYLAIVSALANKGSVFGVEVEDHLLLWTLTVCAGKLQTCWEIADLILGNLNPVGTFPKGVGLPSYPSAYGVDEQLRYELACQKPSKLSDLLDNRIGTASSYSIVLAVALIANQRTPTLQICSTASDHPDVPNHVWIKLEDGTDCDLLRRSMGAHPIPGLRVSRKLMI